MKPTPPPTPRRPWWAGAIILTAVGAWLFAVLRVYTVPPLLDHDGEGAILLCREGHPLRIKLGDQDLDQRPIAHAAISPWVLKAIVAAEDKRFRRHGGIDPVALARALWQNVTQGRRVSGASTLTTQVIRLAEPRPRTPRTKLIEALKAVALEGTIDKDTILEQHLNRAPFGGNLKGIAAAAQIYFGKAASDLTLAESALLAGLPQAPARLRPDRHPRAARRRMDYVLQRMLADGVISPEQQQTALRQPLNVRPRPRPFEAPHFCDWLLRRDGALQGAVRTTLDRNDQRTIEQIVARHHPVLAQRGIHGVAVVVLDVKTGAIRALLGSPDYGDRRQAGMVNGALAYRSPGSALKPFLYAMALDQGLLSPEALLDDSPIRYRDSVPANFDHSFRGRVSVREALADSLNIPALRLIGRVGIRATLDRLRALGLHTLDRAAEDYGAGLILGSGEVTLVDLVNAYACLAREGLYRPYRLREESQTPPGRRLFSAEAAFMIADILGGEARSLDVFGHCADANLPRFAWKTGTSSGFRDAWTVAWNPHHVVGVWLGNPDGTGTPALTGAGAAAPLAGDIFRALTSARSSPWYEPPPELRPRMAANGRSEWYIPGISPALAPEPPKPTALRIVTPPDGASFQRLTAAHLDQTLAFQVEGAESTSPLHWFVNGIHAGQTHDGASFHWPLQEGQWTIVCVAPTGQRSRTAIHVLPACTP